MKGLCEDGQFAPAPDEIVKIATGLLSQGISIYISSKWFKIKLPRMASNQRTSD